MDQSLSHEGEPRKSLSYVSSCAYTTSGTTLIRAKGNTSRHQIHQKLVSSKKVFIFIRYLSFERSGCYSTTLCAGLRTSWRTLEFHFRILEDREEEFKDREHENGID